MPRGHGRTVFIPDNVADRRNSVLSRRSSEQSSRKLFSNENLVLVPVLRNCEESRRVVVRFLALDVHLSRMVVPLHSFIQGPESRNEQGSPNPLNADVLGSHNSSYPHPTIFVQFDLQKDWFPSSQETPAFTSGSAQTVKDYRSSASNVLGEPLRLIRNKSIKNNNNNSPPTAAPKESSWLNYGSDCIASNASADAACKVDKPAKQSPRKKGKKKRKQYKRSMNKKSSVKPENQGEEVNCDASKSETSTGGELVCSAASENNLSLVGACPSLPDQDDSSEVLEQLERNSELSSGISSSTMRKPLDKSINGSRKPVSLPHEFTDGYADKLSFEVTSSSNQSCELSLPTSLQNNPEIDTTEDSLDDCGTEWSIANDGGFNSLENRMNITSRNVSVHGECKEYSHGENGLPSSSCGNCSDSQKDAADTDCSSERLLCSSQASSSDDFHPVIRTKRGRLARKFSGCSNEMHRFNNAHLHRFSETNNKHSSWKKVEKASTSELTRPKNNEKIASQNVDISLNCMETKVRQLNELKQSRRGKFFRCSNGMNSSQSYSAVVSSVVETNSGHISIEGTTYLEKLQRKPNLASELESQCARHTSINNINIPSKIQVKRDENFETAVEFTNISQLTDIINTSLRATESSQNTVLQKATGTDNICSLLQNASSISQEILANSSVIESNSDQSHTDAQFHSATHPSVDMNNDPFICTSKEDIQCNKVYMEGAHLKSSITDNNSRPLLQKCISIGSQDLVITRGQTDDQKYSTAHSPSPSSLNSNFTDDFSSNPNSLVCLSSRERQCSSPSSSYMDCSSPEDGELINKLDSPPFTSSEASSDFSSSSGCRSSPETKIQLFPFFENDLIKIMEAVDESYKLLVSAQGAQGVQLETGSSLAGFERVLHSASPLIETGCISMCRSFSQSQIIGDSLCSHQVPNLSLRRLWQWYEKPGSYGLEVKLDDLYASKRSQTGLSKICAYFVPYLSAVQLFRRCGKSIHDPKEDTEGGLMKTSEVCDTSKCSTGLASLPILSKLLPQPCKKEDTRPTEMSSSGKSEEFNKTMFSEQSADELLFEYFDSDQPQQRRPLFDKIQELILGDSSSNYHFFGDSSKLWSLNLNELHPASWYAVAWYPIYRIPDGSFRAAFLTYHSFGSFVRRSTLNGTDGCINSLTLPVVGLQSYNTQGEFWFEPTNSNSRTYQTDSSTLNSPSENLKGRLQSLERAAYIMSRANIIKGNLNCTNRHPDFEFFLSRKR